MFGRLLSFEPDATGVTVKFEHKEGRISFITDRIVRVYSSMEEQTIKGSCAGTKEG